MAFTYTWDATFEASPADADNISEGALKIRHLKGAISERLEVEHDFEATGKHLAGKCTVLQVDTAANLDLVENGLGYASDTNTLYRGTASGTVAIGFPSGTKMLFYQDTAPTGWTIENTLDDKLVYITKGSAAGGETGGAEHSSGTWTVGGLTAAAHTHTFDVPAHKHAAPIGLTAPHYFFKSDSTPFGASSTTLTIDKAFADNDSSGTVDAALTDNPEGSPTGTTDSASAAVSSDASWRPAAYCCIIASKD